jgi:hypothetical protein
MWAGQKEAPPRTGCPGWRRTGSSLVQRDRLHRVHDALAEEVVPLVRMVSGWQPRVTTTPRRIWDVATGQERLTLRGHTDRVVCVGFDPTGQRLVTGSNDQTARV